MSDFSSLGLSIAVYKPSIVASGTNVIYTPRGTFIKSITQDVTSLSFTKRSMGGYWSMDFGSLGLDVNDWIDDGLGRHIEVYNPDLERIWAGFANNVIANQGALSVVRGPLTGLANRVSAVYRPLDTTVAPPVAGQTTTTVIADDDPSKLAYGIFEKVLSVGAVTQVMANQIRDTYIAEYKDPETSKQFSIPGGSVDMSVGCLGYVHMLQYAMYNKDVVTGTVTISDTGISAEPKLHAVLGGSSGVPITPNADPNNLFYTDNAEITANATLVRANDDENMTGWALIKGLMMAGDVNDNRYTFRVGADRKVFYEQVPTVLSYHQRLADPAQKVTTIYGEEVYPWDVEPGKWLQFTDFLIGTSPADTLREDRRNMLIEDMTYTMPFGLQLNGGKVSRLDSLMGRWALQGIG